MRAISNFESAEQTPTWSERQQTTRTEQEETENDFEGIEVSEEGSGGAKQQQNNVKILCWNIEDLKGYIREEESYDFTKHEVIVLVETFIHQQNDAQEIEGMQLHHSLVTTEWDEWDEWDSRVVESSLERRRRSRKENCNTRAKTSWR